MGGNIVGLYAAQYPDKIASLILACPFGIPFENNHQLDELAKWKIETKEDIRNMMDMVTYKKLHIPDYFLSGILQLRLEKNEFFNKCR